jgi:serine/threonine protein kinase
MPCNVPGCCIKKLENILVDTMKQIKLIDFGIAKELSSNTTANTMGVLSGMATCTHTHTTHTHTHTPPHTHMHTPPHTHHTTPHTMHTPPHTQHTSHHLINATCTHRDLHVHSTRAVAGKAHSADQQPVLTGPGAVLPPDRQRELATRQLFNQPHLAKVIPWPHKLTTTRHLLKNLLMANPHTHAWYNPSLKHKKQCHKNILHHPFFWNNHQATNFLITLGNLHSYNFPNKLRSL